MCFKNLHKGKLLKRNIIKLDVELKKKQWKIEKITTIRSWMIYIQIALTIFKFLIHFKGVNTGNSRWHVINTVYVRKRKGVPVGSTILTHKKVLSIPQRVDEGIYLFRCRFKNKMITVNRYSSML